MQGSPPGRRMRERLVFYCRTSASTAPYALELSSGLGVLIIDLVAVPRVRRAGKPCPDGDEGCKRVVQTAASDVSSWGGGAGVDKLSSTTATSQRAR
jgi:hypothetical protein